MKLEDPTSQHVAQLLRKYSIKIAPPDKPFKLASGGTSMVFCDVKQTLLQPDGSFAVSTHMLQLIHEFEVEHEITFDAVAGVVLGGCPIASGVSNFGFTQGARYSVLYVRKEAKDHGTEKLIEGEVQQGMRVALLEDVSTTGGSALKALEVLRKAGADVRAVFSVVDRSEGVAKDAFKNAHTNFRALFTLDDLT